MTPTPLILCGKTERIGTSVIEGLKPDYETLTFVSDVSHGTHIIPALLSSKSPPESIPLSDLGTKDFSKTPVAIILGGAYDDESLNTLRSAVTVAETARKVPWLRVDNDKPSPPLGPEYGKAIVTRVKALLATLEKEGKLDGKDGEVYFF